MNKFLSLILFLILSITAHAEDKAIIVFDASGSMWGQLEGKTKIAIAKKTLGDVVGNWDDSKQLGLLAYGHRRKGDCKDIETLVPVGKINKEGMINKVNKINPKGKTPISASIRMAADELKFTEDNATVILISDGKETCNADPCATAAELEKLGINFTAHVIGFGVDKKTSEQLKCIADNTGGKFFNADNAKQLNDAFKKVVEQPKRLTLRAIDEKTGLDKSGIVKWKIINQDTEEVISMAGAANHIFPITKEKTTNSSSKTITKGKWLVTATSGVFAGESEVDITGELNQTVKVILTPQLPSVTINAPDETIAGTELDISWDAPTDVIGRIVLQMADEKPNGNHIPGIPTKNRKEASMRVPVEPGDYKFYFFDRRDYKTVITESPITIKPAEIVINAPEETGIASRLDLSWEAPKKSDARINLEPKDEKPKYYTTYHLFTRTDNEGSIRAPGVSGDYVLRWYDRHTRKVMFEKPIKLVEEQITINVPDVVGTGTEIDISWVAPKTSEGKITLESVGEKPKYYSNPHLYTKKKTEGTMRMPSTAGDYVLRWYNIVDRKEVMTHPIKLIEEQIVITAPDEAGTGTEIDLSWQAPKTAEAKITLESIGEKPIFHARTYLYTKNKKEATMRLPSTAGDYVLRWYNLSDRKIASERPIKLVEEQITLSAPDEAGAGTEIDISWVAPKTAEAKITLESVGEKPKFHSTSYLYTKKKTMATLRTPSDEGDYILRYYNLSDRKILAERPIKLIAQSITLSAPESATAGTEVEISWDAPKGLKAYINLQPSEDRANYNSRPYFYTKKKQSEYMRMPSSAGDYTLRWYNQKDRKVLAERQIKLTAAEVSITAPDEAIAGTEVELSWQAPKGLDSFINVQMADEKPNYNAKAYIYTKKKTSGYLRLPSTAGDYILRWYNRNDRKMLTERPIKLVEPEITITVPDEIMANSEIEISWQAPKGLDNSFINLQQVDEKPNYNAKSYFYTKKKSSEYMKMPTETGEYVLRWYNRNDRKMVAEKKITIK